LLVFSKPVTTYPALSFEQIMGGDALELILIAVVGFFAWVAVRGYMRGKAFQYRVNYDQAEKAAVASANAGDSEQPSWWGNADKMELFTNAIKKTMDREGVSAEARRTLFQDEYTRSAVLAHAASMERNDSSFVEQQMGAADLAVKLGKAVDAKLKQGVKFTSEDAGDDTFFEALSDYLRIYDSGSDESQNLHDITMWGLNTAFVQSFGDVDGFRSAPDQKKLKFYELISKMPDEETHDGSGISVEMRCRSFVLNILVLSDKFPSDQRPQLLTVAIRRWREIADNGARFMEGLLAKASQSGGGDPN